MRAADLATRVPESTSIDTLGEQLHEIYDTDAEIVVHLHQRLDDEGDDWSMRGLSVAGLDARTPELAEEEFEADNAVADWVSLIDFKSTSDQRVREDDRVNISIVL